MLWNLPSQKLVSGLSRIASLAFVVGCVGCVKNDPGGISTAYPAAVGQVALSFDELIVTSGAAPGYVADKVCAHCHRELYDSYQHVGMAQSFYRPRAEKVIEDFAHNQFYHAPSQRFYEMTHRDGNYFFKRYQRDEQGQPINVFQRKVDWILGSGRHLRAYLFQTEAGELYQLPIAWSRQSNAWVMSADFFGPDHAGVTRAVSRECMFCHNAYPDVPAGSDSIGTRDAFPAELPHGTGCQRCHGPGAEHVRIALDEHRSRDSLVSSIVNPARLPARRQQDVCNSCHLQPSAALAGVRRFGRSVYSYRPGEPLEDYLVQVDVVDRNLPRAERFEINHHAYRLRQSRCFTETAGGMSCTICHDPHRKVPSEKRAAHYRSGCMKCHQGDDCRLEIESNLPAHDIDSQDCAGCHMQRRPTQDAVHVTMTDHMIRRVADKAGLLAEPGPGHRLIADTSFLVAMGAPAGNEGEIYRAAALLRAASYRDQTASDKLQQLLEVAELSHTEPYLDLAQGQIMSKRFADAERTANTVLARDKRQAYARLWLGVALIGQGKNDEAVATLRELVGDEPQMAEARYNLGLVLFAKQQYQEATQELQQAVRLRPVLFMGWFYLGNTFAKLNRMEEAIDCFRTTLEIEPRHRRAYSGMRDALTAVGRSSEAMRYWQHGINLAAGPLRGAAGPAAETRVGESGPVKLARIPAPELAHLEKAVSSQLAAARASFDELVSQENLTRAEVAEACGMLGQLYHAYELHESAAACYQNARRLSSTDYRWPHLLGAVYEQQGDLQEAAKQFEAASALNHDNAATAVHLGNIYVQLNRLDEARKEFETALKINNDEPAAHAGMGDVLLAERRYEQAIEYIDRALKIVPAANRLHYSLAMAYRGLGNVEKANQHLEKLGKVGIRPIDPLLNNLHEQRQGERIHLVRGQAAFNAGRYKDAEEAFYRAVEADPQSARAQVNLGSALGRQGKNDAAIIRFKRALELEPDNFAAYFNLGLLTKRKRAYDEAVEHFAAAVNLRPDDLSSNYQLANTLVSVGRQDDARQQYLKVLELAPDNESALLELSNLLTGREQYREVHNLLEQAEHQFPGRLAIRGALARLLAACPDAAVRNGARAVELSATLFDKTQRWEDLETYALALAETGQCAAAAKVQRELIAEAERQNNSELVQRLTKDLLHYEQGRPCRPLAADIDAASVMPPEPDGSTEEE